MQNRLPIVKHVVYVRHNPLRRMLLYSTSQNDVAKMLTQHSEAVCSSCLYQCTVTGLGGKFRREKLVTGQCVMAHTEKNLGHPRLEDTPATAERERERERERGREGGREGGRERTHGSIEDGVNDVLKEGQGEGRGRGTTVDTRTKCAIDMWGNRIYSTEHEIASSWGLVLG